MDIRRWIFSEELGLSTQETKEFLEDGMVPVKMLLALDEAGYCLTKSAPDRAMLVQKVIEGLWAIARRTVFEKKFRRAGIQIAKGLIRARLGWANDSLVAIVRNSRKQKAFFSGQLAPRSTPLLSYVELGGQPLPVPDAPNSWQQVDGTWVFPGKPQGKNSQTRDKLTPHRPGQDTSADRARPRRDHDLESILRARLEEING